MMATHKNLHELLKEDQEPFLLNKYIADRRSLLKAPTQITTLHPKKRKSIVEASTSKRNLCRHACFLSFNDSPDVNRSPFNDFPSPLTGKSTPNRVRLQIPARTAALLLDAATKIQKQSSSKPRSLSVRFGLIGSILKRLSSKNRNRKCEISGDGAPKSERMCEEVEEDFDYENSRRNSTVWSESNGEDSKSVDSETSTSARSDDSEIDYAGEQLIDNGGFSFPEKHFCSSPLSPFRFALERYPSPGRRTPIFSSPAASPIRPHKQESEKHDQESLKKTLQEEEEEEKEQCSPVSVLDRPFEDYDDAGHEDDEEDDEDDYDMECSYATVQRSKLQLLQKLQRFEKLAELDPVELEKRMLEEYNSEEDDSDEEDYEDDEKKSLDSFVREVLAKSGLHFAKVSTDMKRLVLDLVTEEESECGASEAVVARVCERLDSWNEVQSNTIDMMVELDFRREVDGWKREDKEQVGETAREIEVAIFGLLMEELSHELGLGC